MRQVWSEESQVQRWFDVEAAIAVAHRELGILESQVAQRIIEFCDVARVTPDRIAAHKKKVDHLMVAVMHAFAEACAPEGDQFHLGATTQDILDTGMNLQIRDAGVLIQDSLLVLHRCMLDIALQHKDTAMMGRTHAQHATPLTFGFKVMLWCSELEANYLRLKAALAALNYSSVSGAVGSNASFLALVGEENLGHFHELIAETLEMGCSDQDLHQRLDRYGELVSALVLAGSTLGRIGLEIRDLQRPEVGELEEPLVTESQYASSTMPNKRNPSRSELMQALAKLLRGTGAAIGEVAMQHERDATWLGVQMAVIPEAFLLLSGSLRMANTVFAGLIVHPRKMRENLYLQHGVAMAENVMLKAGLCMGNKLHAHRICYEAAMSASQNHQSLGDALRQHPEFARIGENLAIDELLDPESYCGNCAEQVESYATASRGLDDG